MIPIESSLLALKFLVAGSIFFVWVVRYENIVKEFEVYGISTQLRDLVGILKLSSAAMLLSGDSKVTIIGASMISLLMMAAFITHIRVRSPINKFIPSAVLMSLSLFIAIASS